MSTTVFLVLWHIVILFKDGTLHADTVVTDSMESCKLLDTSASAVFGYTSRDLDIKQYWSRCEEFSPDSDSSDDMKPSDESEPTPVNPDNRGA